MSTHGRWPTRSADASGLLLLILTPSTYASVAQLRVGSLRSAGRREILEVGVDHRSDELCEFSLGLPPEMVDRLARVSDEGHGFAGSDELRIDDHVRLVVEPDVLERDAHHVPDRPRHSRADHVIPRALLLEHSPHRLHDVPREGPV